MTNIQEYVLVVLLLHLFIIKQHLNVKHVHYNQHFTINNQIHVKNVHKEAHYLLITDAKNVHYRNHSIKYPQNNVYNVQNSNQFITLQH